MEASAQATAAPPEDWGQPPWHIGVDFGSSKVRASIFAMTGRELAHASRPAPLVKSKSGQLSFAIVALTDAALDCIAATVKVCPQPANIAAIAAASVGESFVLYDSDHRPLDDAIFWNDYRAADQTQRIIAKFGEQWLAEQTGNHYVPILAMPKLYWQKETKFATIRDAHGVLILADWFALVLSGQAKTNVQHAARWGAAELRTEQWLPEILRFCGIEPSLMPPILPGGQRLGLIRPAIAKRTGLPATCVVGTGGHDHITGCMGIGAGEPGVWMASLGTAGMIGQVSADLPGPPTVPQIQQGSVRVAGGEPRYYHIGGVNDCCAAFERFRRCHGDLAYAELDDLAACGQPGAARFKLNAIQGTATDDTKWFERSFSGSTKPADRYLALIDAQAQTFIDFVNVLRMRPGKTQKKTTKTESLKIIGGGRRYKAFMHALRTKWQGDVFVCGLDEATTLGAAMLGCIAAGNATNLDEAVARLEIDWQPIDF